MNTITVDKRTDLPLLVLPKYVFDIEGITRNKYENLYRTEGELFYKLASKRIAIGSAKPTENSFFDTRDYKTMFMDFFEVDRNIHFTRYEFWYDSTDNAYGSPSVNEYQEYILYMLRVQEMPIDILIDYLQL